MNIKLVLYSLLGLRGIALLEYLSKNTSSDDNADYWDDYWDELTNYSEEEKSDLYAEYLEKTSPYDEIPDAYTIVNGNSLIRIIDIEDYDDVDDPGDLY